MVGMTRARSRRRSARRAGRHFWRAELEAGEFRERPPRADHLRPAPIAQGERLADLVAHELAQLPHVLPPRCEAEELFGEPERAEREGDEALHEPFGRKRELEGAAAE